MASSGNLHAHNHNHNHIISYHIMSYHISYHVISYHIISCHVISCHVISRCPDPFFLGRCTLDIASTMHSMPLLTRALDRISCGLVFFKQARTRLPHACRSKRRMCRVQNSSGQNVCIKSAGNRWELLLMVQKSGETIPLNYFEVLIHLRWFFRISAINSIITGQIITTFPAGWSP